MTMVLSKNHIAYININILTNTTMQQLLILLLFPLIVFSQETKLIGDVDCDGDITSQDKSLILQFLTNDIDELPCEENTKGLSPSQLNDIIAMINSQINNREPINMIGPMYISNDFEFTHKHMVESSSSDKDMMYYLDAIRFCAQLKYDGFEDWFLPSFYQIDSYIYSTQSDQIVIPNNSNGEKYFWLYGHVRKEANAIGGSGSQSMSVKSAFINGIDSDFPNELTRVDAMDVNSQTYCFCVR